MLVDENLVGCRTIWRKQLGVGTDLVVAFPALPPPLNSEESSYAKAQRGATLSFCFEETAS